jgi:hypothetical protein
MSDQERIDRIEQRQDDQERRIAAKLDQIFKSLEEMRLERVKNMATTERDLERAVNVNTATLLRVERLELKMIDLERKHDDHERESAKKFACIDQQKSWFIGAFSVVGFVSSILGALSIMLIKYWLEKS